MIMEVRPVGTIASVGVIFESMEPKRGLIPSLAALCPICCHSNIYSIDRKKDSFCKHFNMIMVTRKNVRFHFTAEA
jgi:hypothetical protein